jgi:hypothetical protein
MRRVDLGPSTPSMQDAKKRASCTALKTASCGARTVSSPVIFMLCLSTAS